MRPVPGLRSNNENIRKEIGVLMCQCELPGCDHGCLNRPEVRQGSA